MTTTTQSLTRTAILNVTILTIACLIPAASHLLAMPLYVLNPMLALLMASILIVRDGRNALLMAVLLPSVSFIFTGMPSALKMICMITELATVATLFDWLKRRWAVLPAMLISVIAAKVVYYALKALIIAPAVLVSTQWTIQLLTILLWTGIFSILYKKA